MRNMGALTGRSYMVFIYCKQLVLNEMHFFMSPIKNVQNILKKS